MKRPLLVACAVLALLLAAWPVAASGGDEKGSRGVVFGNIAFVGGPPPGGVYPRQAGRVFVENAAGERVAATRVRRHHGFHFRLAPGRYKLTARLSPGSNFHRFARVRANHRTWARIDIPIP